MQVLVAEDERFERHGQELVTVVEVPATRAMLGGTVTVPTLDGEREVEVAAGAQPGEHIVVRGLGLPSLRGAARGDQHVVLDIQVPSELSKEQRELAERLDESLGSANSGGSGRRGSRRRARARRGG